MPGVEDQKIAVIGSGAAGLSAAWLLSMSCHVTLFEKDDRLGGHAHTADVKSDPSASNLAIDTGFIVYNEKNYPNFTRWMQHLGVQTQPSDMTFSVSRDNRRYEYKGGTLRDLLVQPSNLLKPRFYRMLRDIVRFYRTFSGADAPPANLTLGDLLIQGNYSREFIDDHLLPFAAAIWSGSPDQMLQYPAASFVRFCDNHGLLSLSDRPQWRTVTGGSREYVSAAREVLGQDHIRTSLKVESVKRVGASVVIEDREGNTEVFDAVVFASHADQALMMLADADSEEQRLLKPFTYRQNLAILHTDKTLMPRRKRAWASWNYLDNNEPYSDHRDSKNTLSYWMNNLQNLSDKTDYIVSLNPAIPPDPERILRTMIYEHPVFNTDTYSVQQQLWSLQGRRNTWFCGAYFGAGFHEDAIQSGLAVAEQLGGLKRPWEVADASGRIFIDSPQAIVPARSKYAADAV